VFVTVENPDSIDSVTLSADGRRYHLLMTEERLFADSDEQFLQLMEKINAYAEFIQTGQLYNHFPEARGKALAVRLVCRNEPSSERFVDLLRAGTALLARQGADFSIEVIPDELLGLRPPT
jgi:hypothetical protein